MYRPEYMRIKRLEITQEFIEEYNLTQLVQNGWIYFEIIRVCYSLSQSGRLANDFLRTRLEKAGYYEEDATPDLWCHRCHPIEFVLIVHQICC